MSLKRTLSRALALTFGLSLCAAATPSGKHGGMIDPDGLRLAAGVRPAAAGGGDHGGMIDPDGLRLATGRGDHGGMIDPDGRV